MEKEISIILEGEELALRKMEQSELKSVYKESVQWRSCVLRIVW